MSIEEMDFSSSLARFNSLSEAEATEELLRCCGSQTWAATMCASRPFSSVEHLLERAHIEWWKLGKEHWLQAFAAHPKIDDAVDTTTTATSNDNAGLGDAKALKAKFTKSSWEGQEQSGANAADESTLSALAALNEEYLIKNGFIFLICATGKSAREMLEALRVRLDNDTETEMQIAAGEQAKITNLRIYKLLDSYKTGAGSKL